MSTPATVKKPRRWRRHFFVAVALIILLPLVCVFIALNNSTATRYALQTMSSYVQGLSVGEIDGTVGDELTINDLQFANDSLTVNIERLRLRARLGALAGGNVVLDELVVTGVRATPNPSAPPTAAKPLEVKTLAAPLALTVHRLQVNDAQWTPLPDLPLTELTAALSWSGTSITISHLAAATNGGTLTGDAQIDTHGDVRVSSLLSWAYPEQSLTGTLSAQGSLKSLALSHELTGPYQIDSSGSIKLLGRIEPAIELRHTCVEPCVIETMDIRQGSLSHTGTPSDSKITLNARLAADPLQSTEVTGRLHFVDGALAIDSLAASGAQLRASLGGRIAPGNAPLFELDVAVAHLDAALLNAQVTGSMQTDLTVVGDSAQSFDVTIKNLAGNINGYELTGGGQVQRAGDQLVIDDASVALGDNLLALNGTANVQALDLNATVTLPSLEQLDPRVSGSIAAVATIRGHPQSPVITANGEAGTVSFAGQTLAAADFNLDIDKSRAVSGSATLRDMKRDTLELGTLALQLGGTLDVVELSAELDNPALDATVVATIAPTSTQTVVRIQNAVVNAEDLGTWSVAQPVEIRATPGSLTIDPHRWQSDDAFAQVHELQQIDGDLSARIDLADLPLGLAAGFLPPDVSIAGSVGAQIDAKQRSGVWRGRVNWTQNNTVLKLRSADGSRRLSLPVVALQVEQASDAATANLQIEGDFGLNVQANLTALRPDQLGASPIEGQLRADMKDVSWLTPWLSGVSNLAGTLKAMLDLDGSAADPKIAGNVEFENGALTYTAAGLQLEQMQLAARTTDSGELALKGAANSGGGALQFEGTVEQPWAPQRVLSLDVNGEDVQAFNAADYQLWLSPALTLNASAKGVNLSGDVRVPRADIRVRELPPDVVRPSDDIVVTGRTVTDKFALPFDGDIRVTLGDDVHVFALGLDADVGGDLRVRLNADQPPRLDGRIFLAEGRYAAYGQKLQIERGNLIYAGPIDNPTLDLRAARTINEAGAELTAGVMVAGPAAAPEISIFTDPTTSQTDALSYLLLGRAAGDTSGAEGEALSQAALAIGMSQSSPLTTRLASGLGLDELSVGGDDVDTAELVAGKQLNDRLYIRYSYGVFSNLGAILLRYRLSRRLALEAGSSDIQSIDVLYTIEK
ncbi:MAG: translocation/assembly module TamB domain-containing protein [Gammaproteobacteria bacterium]